MKITIVGSSIFAKEMVEYKGKLEGLGHQISIHDHYVKLANGEANELAERIQKEHAALKIEHDYIRYHYNEIVNSDAILVLNFDKNGIKNYIGGNTLMELGFAHVHNKRIFLLNPVPEIGYKEEIEAVRPIVLDGDLNKINMKLVVIASENPVKIEVAKQAFSACFPQEQFNFIPLKSDSKVGHQPIGEEKTVLGVKNRILGIRQKYPDADYYVSQEGGVVDEGDIMHETAYVAVEDKYGFRGVGKTASFLVPYKIAEYVRQGDELGIANDKFFNLTNSKQQGGMIGSLTEGIIDRTKLYFQAAVIALMQIKHKEWYIS